MGIPCNNNRKPLHSLAGESHLLYFLSRCHAPPVGFECGRLQHREAVSRWNQSRPFDTTHRGTARHAIIQCHWSGRSDNTTSIPAILVTESAGGQLGAARIRSPRWAEEEGTYLPPIGVVLVGTEVISGREMLRNLRTELVCAEGPAVVKNFGYEESP